MRRKEKNSGEQTKAPKRRWGVGKTLSVIFASVAFIVGIAILGVYLAGGFTERTTIPQDISFNAQNDPNFNSDLNRLEITSSSFELTIGSTTENVTSDVVTLGFSYTYAYKFDTQSFTDVGWGITETGDGYLENGVLRIPKQVRIGVPFTIEVLTYDYTYTDSDGTQEIIDQIRGGISTITATSQNPDLTPTPLTIAVDSPVYKTEVVLLDAHKNEITPNGDISEVTEEERFDVITKFYPAESRYIYADPKKTKTSFYQLSNVSSEVVNVVYDSSTSLHFEAGLSAEGGTITAFTAVNAKVQEQVEADVLAMGLTDNESIYNAYLQHYGNLARDQVLTDEANFNVVQANVKEFTIGKSGQSFKIHDQADLRIFLGNAAEAPDIPLGVEVIAQNGAALNNILANVALSFSLNDQDPTIASGEGSPILTVKGGNGQTLTPTALDGVNYYFPFINKGVTDYNNAFWDLRVASGNVDASITVTVSLLLGNAEDGYQLFDGQAEFTLSVIEHVENDVSWAEGTDLTQELLLTYDEGSTNPDPTPFLLAGLTNIPTDNIFRTVAYFVAFDDSLLGEGDDTAKTEAAITLAQQIFDGLVDGSRAGVYQTATGNRILVPLAITGDTLTVQEVGQFDLYFATVNGTAESGLYNVVRMVGSPISITVTKTLYVNSVSGAQVLVDSALNNEGGFAKVTENTFIPTISDNTEKDQIQLVFTIASDSATVFEEEFQNGRISLEIYSNENIINSNFTISNGQFTISEEDQIATLTYTLTANSSFTVSADTQITAIALAYSGNGSVQPINWSFSNIYVSGNVSLYTPVPAESGVVLDKEGLAESYEVKQILNAEGKFETTITPGNLTLAELILSITDKIQVTDQHGRTDTLQNSWTFTSTNAGEQGSTNPLQIRPGDDGVAGQGFAFSGEGSATLGVACGGANAANTIGFKVSAQGITKIEYDANGEETANHDPTKNLGSADVDEYLITSITGEDELASVQTITVTKYGMSGATFNLSDLVRFYVGDDGATQYTHISFKLSPKYLFGTADLTDMFGENGMITLTGDKISDISASGLQNANIISLTLNHNFGQNHTITFLVTDESGAVNYTFELNILNNTSVSAPSTVETGTNGGPLYANEKRENINATITYDYHSSDNAFPSNLLTNGYIVPNGNEGNYIISQESDNAVGEIDADGNATFYHFFRDATKEFAVRFYPEGVNSYTLNATIKFKVTRNVKIDQKKSNVDAFAADPEVIANNYFTICQISDGTQINDIYINYYIGTGGNNYLQADASGSLTNIQVAQNLIFDYGITSLAQNIIITINSKSYVDTSTNDEDVLQQTVTLNVVLPDDFWSDLAGDLTAGASTPSWQFAGGTNKRNYLVVESGQTYKIGSYEYGETDYTISISNNDGINGNRLRYYSVYNTNPLTIRYGHPDDPSSVIPSNDLLYGYGEGETVYTYMTLTTGDKKIVLRVPTIISQIGTKFVSYDGFDENSLDLSKQTWQQLYTEGNYNTITAGSEIDLSDFINLPANANFNITTSSQSFTIGGSAGGYVQNAIGSLIYDWTGQGALTLNHLSSAIENAYLFIEYTISTASGSESFGYLFKVEPSVVLDEPNYPYGGAAEYITMSESGSETLFDLDETFDSSTIQGDHSRFEYTFDPAIEDAEDLLYTDQVVSIRVGTQTYTNPAQWSGYINAQISVDTSASSSTIGHSFLVLSSLNTTSVVEIVVRRTYGGTGYSDGQPYEGKSIVGGTIDYHFVLNDNPNYTIRVKNGSNIQNGVTNYTWYINNWASGSTRATENSDEEATTREETIYFYLLEIGNSGSASSSNEIRNTLYFNLHDQDGWTVEKNADNSFTATSKRENLKFIFNYTNSGLTTNGTFTVTYPEYLSQDYAFSATLYTDHGALSKVTFVFHADANATIVDNSHAGGQDVSIDRIFTIKTSDTDASSPTITSVTINSYTNGEENLRGFVNVGTQDGKITIQLASTVEDIVGDLTLTVEWKEGTTDNKTTRSYTFTISNFTITANIEQEQSLVFNNQIGGQSCSISADDLLKNVEANGTFSNRNSTITLTANPSNSAIDNGNSTLTGESLTIVFNQVGKVTEATMPVTVTVTSEFANNAYREITIEVTFSISPSVKISPVYPTPSDEMLELEYLENNTTFSAFGTNFLGGNAIFSEQARVKVQYARVSGSVGYDDDNPLNIGLGKQVIIKEITNAVVTDVTNSGKALRINDKIELGHTITFTRGTGGGTSQVVLSISYNSYVMDYTIQIVDTAAFVLTVNQASNNISADSDGQYETLYVDKTDSTDLLAKNRMLRATLSSRATAGDYYIFFVENGVESYAATDVLASKIINLSENFVTNSRNSTIYLDLGNNGLSTVVLGAESGQYTPVMILDSVYERVLSQENDENDALLYIAENYNNPDATITLTNYFDSTFTNASLSSRVTMTYGGHEVAYNKFSGELKYHTSSTDTEGSVITTALSVDENSEIGGSATTAITKFSFGYSNGGYVGETESASIAKEFQASYRYLADLDIVVGAVSDNGGSVTLQANATINLVEKFNVRRKTTGEQIQMSDMVSGNANFILTTVDNTNEVGNGARYLGISAVRTDEVDEEDRTTYDWIITGNGADNDGQDVNLTLEYSIGNFKKEFNLTVHVVNDYSITFDGSGDLNYEGDDGNIPSNQSPYSIDTSAAIFEDGSAQILLAGESTTINGGSVASTPYMSITHRNASGQGERSVLDFSYTITTNQISGDTTYNIPNNINAKLEMSSNNWTESTTDNTTTYTWNKGTARSLVMKVNQVVFGSQFYRIQLVDEYGYTIYLYFTLDSGEDSPEIYTTSGDSSLSLTEGETVAFGAQYQRLSVTANNNEPLKPGKNELTITASPLQDPCLTTGDANVSQIINISNIDAWGFDQNYTEGNVEYFVGEGYGAGDEGYIIDDDNIVGDDGEHTFSLSETNSQEYLKLPNFRFVTIDSITYYYNNGGSLIEVGSSGETSINEGLATASGLNHASKIYKSANEVSLTLPSVDSNYTWIYGNANQAFLTMVVRLKYDDTPSVANDEEYFDISRNITLSKTTQMSEQNNLVADNEPFALKDYINVTAGGSDEQNYTIYDDTLAVAIAPNSQTNFDLIYTNADDELIDRVSLTLSNANYGWTRLYYRSLSERFNTVLTSGTIKIVPKDQNATFYYGLDTTGNKPLSQVRETSFVKVANVDYFTVETYSNGEWTSYTEKLGSFEYNSEVGGYLLSAEDEIVDAGTTVTVPFENANYRISYNNTSYYPAQTLTITTITQDRITIANKNDMSSGTVGVDQYYVIQRNQSEQTIYSPYRYRASFTVTGTYQSVFAPNTVRTLPLDKVGGDAITISEWANESIYYTQVGASYQLSFTKAEGVDTFKVLVNNAQYTGPLTINGSTQTETYDVSDITASGTITVSHSASFDIVYGTTTYTASASTSTEEGGSTNYKLEFTKLHGENSFTVQTFSGGSWASYSGEITINENPASASGDGTYSISEIASGDSVTVNMNVQFRIVYANLISDDNDYRATLVENSLAEYSNDNGDNNLYFVITSGSSGTGGTGLATIDYATGAISILPGFTADHFVTVQIYQKVSGIDGSFSGTDVSDMYLLAELRIYPEPTRQISGGGITLSDYLPEGTYYENESYEITVPASTTADLVVYNGTREINRISLANDTDASVSQTFTTATLLGSAVNNYDSTSGITLKIENASSGSLTGFTIKAGSGTATNFTEDGNTISFGQEFTTDSITFNNAQYLTKTYIVLQAETLLFRSITFENKDYQAN